MSNRDLMNDVHPVAGIAPAAAVTTNAASVSAIVDTRGFDSATWLIITGVLTDADATFAVLLEDGDDSGLSDAAAVADAQLVGTEALAGYTFADDSEARKLGYIGPKRYLRLTITPAANTGNHFVAAICLLGHAYQTPTANPPV